MADLNDVSAALVALVAQAVYPNGTGQASAAGVPARIFAGWPDPQALDADLVAGTCQVSVFPTASERNTSRFPKDWQTLSTNTPTLTAVIAGQTVTIGGTVPGAQNPTNISVLANGQPYVYAVQVSDTLTSIATALASLIAAGIAGTTNTGPVITLPAAARLTAARLGVSATQIRELRRQVRAFQVSIWADTPDHRTAIATVVDLAFAKISFLTLSDTFAARVLYTGSPINDGLQKERLYRRDLMYTVEYATTETNAATQVTQEVITVTPTNAATATINL